MLELLEEWGVDGVGLGKDVGLVDLDADNFMIDPDKYLHLIKNFVRLEISTNTNCCQTDKRTL